MEGIELGGDQQFCLRWNNFQANITSQFEALRDDEDFVDVTLACEGVRLEAHKVVLSACSPFFKELFKSNPCPHPIVFMRDCEAIHVRALLEFMYAGQVNIAQAQLSAFLRTAEALQIRGLTDASPPSNVATTKKGERKSPPSQLRNLLSTKTPIPRAESPDQEPIDTNDDQDENSDKCRQVLTHQENSSGRVHHDSLTSDDVVIPSASTLLQPKQEPDLDEFSSHMYYAQNNSLANPFSAITGNIESITGVEIPRDFTGEASQPWFDQRHTLPPDRIIPPKLIKLCDGVEVREEALRGVKWGDYRKVTRGLAAALFTPAELATCSVTGQRWSRAGQEARPTKPPLDRRRVHALISYVSRQFPDVEVSRIKQVLAYKCKENCAALRMRAASDTSNILMSGLNAALRPSHDDDTRRDS